MHIGVNLMYLRPGRVGGSETYTRELLSHLRSATDASLTLFCNLEAYPTFDSDDRVTVVRVSEKETSDARRLLDENWTLIRHIKNSNIDVLFSPANIGAPFLPRRIPQVVTVHDLQHRALRSHFSRTKRLTRAVMFGMSSLRCRRLIVVSEHTKRDVIEALPWSRKKVATIYEGVDQDLKAPAERVERTLAKFGLAEKRFFYYPAMLTAHKNHKVLIEAFARAFPEEEGTRLIFTGKETDYLTTIESHIRERDLNDRARYLGYVSREEVADLLTGALAVTYASRFEGFGLPVLEAMSCETAVLASRSSSIPEVAGDAAPLISPDDVHGWADAMRSLARSPDLVNDLVSRGLKQVARFSWDECARRTLEVFRQAARV